MEQNSLENCETEGQYGNKIDGVCKRFCDIDSPKVVRHPLQAFNSPVMVNPKVQSSVTITPYRYHGCKVIHEEVENQENVDPKRLFHSDSDHTAQKSREPNNVGISPNSSSPFSYPLILEGCHLSSSSSSSYKSTLGQSGRHHEVSNCNYGSPKTPFTTPRGKSLVMGNNYEHSHSSRAGNDIEGCDTLHSKLLCNGGHRIGNTGWTLTRGLVSGNGSLSSSTGSSHKNVVTPSKSSCSSGLSDRSVFQTPGSYSSSSSENRVVTPQQRRKGYKQKLNPFDVGVDHLHMPTVSPSLFRQVVSPAYEKFQWSIDELALLKPANIETSPYNQSEASTDPEYEVQAQAAIDKFFSGQPVVPSPWMGSNKSISLVSMNLAPEKAVSSNPVPITRTISCQTELSLPMVLPESVEAALKPYLTFTQDQGCQGATESEECNNLNNTTLRRKLLFSAEDLVNATPMCSPHGTTSPESSASSSPVAPLPLHDDDDINIEFNVEDTKGLHWCAEIFQPSFNNLIDPSQRRRLPSTPPFPSGNATEEDLITASDLPRKYDCFSSPQYESEPMHLLDLSPIEGQICSTTSQRRSLSSTNLSPIQPNTNFKSYECMLTLPSGAEMAHPKCRMSLSVPSNVNSPSIVGFSNTGCEIQTYNSKEGNDRSTFDQRGSDNVSMVCDKSEEIVSNSSERISGSSVTSHNAIGLFSPKNKTFVPKFSPAAVSKVFHEEVVWVETSQSNNQEAFIVHGSNSEGKGTENQEIGNAVQKKSPSSKAENSSSGNSAHFSSSPIRDCKTVSYSPPLSPILCRSISVQSQGDQVKSQGHYGEDCQFTREDVSQLTVLSVDMEAVRSTTEEEITLDEDVSSVGTAKLGYPMTNAKHFTDIQEFSSVCDMDTDLQQSFEISVCHEAKSQESGYQTGSMQSTNFSMTTFTSNSTICSSASFQKDRLPSIFSTDSSNFYSISKVNDRKTLSQSNMHCKNHAVD